MARIAGVDLRGDKKVFVSLLGIYGIGRCRAIKITQATDIDKDKLVKDLNEQEVLRLRDFIESSYKVEGSLKSEIFLNLKRLKEINCYRGVRHKRGLPAHGQRTHSNAKTRRSKGRR